MHFNTNSLQAINLFLFDLAQMTSENLANINANVFSDLGHKMFKRSKTINEIVAIEMLEQYDWIKSAIHAIKYKSNDEQNGDFINPTDSLDKLELLIKKIRSHENSKFSRLFVADNDSNLILNVCNHCKGDIKIL